VAHGETLKAKLQQAAESVALLKLSVFRARLQFQAKRKKMATSRKPGLRTKRNVTVAEAKLKARTKALQSAQKKFDVLYEYATGAKTPKPRVKSVDGGSSKMQKAKAIKF
jgi:hypothetical protein